MSKSVPALVNPDLLQWARKYSQLGIDYVAHNAGLEIQEITSWESGNARPSISQLRRLAKVYRLPIAAFYLPTPPAIKTRRPKDRRFLPGFELEEPTPELSFEFRRVAERREIFLELISNLSDTPRQFTAETSIHQVPEIVSAEIRQLLGVNLEEQTTWHNPRIAFGVWREKLESLGVLVFQTTTVPLDQMRGFSLYHDPLPIIAVNRKDTYTARIFTLMHEMVHLMLRTESLCDMRDEGGRIDEPDYNIEIFCNSIAASALVPSSSLLEDRRVDQARGIGLAGDKAISELSLRYSVSREVIVRRMLSLGLIDEEFYRQKRTQYQKEFNKRPYIKGWVCKSGS